MTIAREGWPVIGTAAGVLGLVGAVGALAGHPAALVPLVLAVGFCLYFFRDPERRAPSDERLVVSPARHTAGKFRAAFADKASLDNERTALVLESGGRRYLLEQIAGALARRIVCRVRPGDRVQRGERFGMIMFGSRVDLFLPVGVVPVVHRGDRVRAGTSVIAEVKS